MCADKGVSTNSYSTSTYSELCLQNNSRSKKNLIMSLLPVNRSSLGWLCVRQKLRLNTVAMVHKCRINQAPPYLCNLFHDRFSVSGGSTRNNSQLNLPKCRLSTGQRSLAFHGAKESYNLLPEYIRATNNILSFKRKAAAHFLKNIS